MKQPESYGKSLGGLFAPKKPVDMCSRDEQIYADGCFMDVDLFP